MTDDMVERVARAIDPNAWDDLVKIFGLPGRARRQELSLISARAAIEAMREPTDFMIGRGLEATFLSDLLKNPENELAEIVRLPWQSMIDAALASPHTADGESK